MKTIIAGSRYITSAAVVYQVIEQSGFEITEVVSGCALGVDTIGELYAHDNGIPVRSYPADWATHGKAAGPIRNKEMAANAEQLIAIWDGNMLGSGTKNMIEEAFKKSLRIYVRIIKPYNHAACDWFVGMQFDYPHVDSAGQFGVNAANE